MKHQRQSEKVDGQNEGDKKLSDEKGEYGRARGGTLIAGKKKAKRVEHVARRPYKVSSHQCKGNKESALSNWSRPNQEMQTNDQKRKERKQECATDKGGRNRQRKSVIHRQMGGKINKKTMRAYTSAKKAKKRSSARGQPATRRGGEESEEVEPVRGGRRSMNDAGRRAITTSQQQQTRIAEPLSVMLQHNTSWGSDISCPFNDIENTG